MGNRCRISKIISRVNRPKYLYLRLAFPADITLLIPEKNVTICEATHLLCNQSDLLTPSNQPNEHHYRGNYWEVKIDLCNT